MGYTSEYEKSVRKNLFFIFILFFLCILSFVIDVSTGIAEISFKDIWASVFMLNTSNENAPIVVWGVRLPCALMAIGVGGTLGLAGASMQTILDNPLASPYTLGISASAGFGASLAMVRGTYALPIIGPYSVPIFAFFFSTFAITIIFIIGKLKFASSEVMVLSGIGILFLFQALQSFMQYIATPEVLQSIVFWIFGSLSRSNMNNVMIVLFVFVICSILIFMSSWKLTAMRLGDEKARNLGVNVEKLRIKIFITVSVLTAVAVSFVGTIGFIGLVGPHIARMLVGEDQRFFLPLSALCGMVILSLASIGSKTLVPGIIFPIGIITSIIGIPFFFSLIFTKKWRA